MRDLREDCGLRHAHALQVISAKCEFDQLRVDPDALLEA